MHGQALYARSVRWALAELLLELEIDAMRRTRAFLIGPSLTAIAMVVVACGSVGRSAESPAADSSAPLDQIHQQAQDALKRWAAAVVEAGGQQGFSVVGEKTGQVGSWEDAVAGSNKMALMYGLVRAGTDLSDAVPPPAEVRWDDGTAKRLPLISARQALMELQADGHPCQECTPLVVTGATLGLADVMTMRGPATAPVWEFTAEGTSVLITRVAVAQGATVTVSPAPADPSHPFEGMSIESASGAVGGRELQVTFVGAPGPASKPCGADYEAEAVESSLAVVVIVIAHANQTSVACTAVGALRTASVQLAEPLGDRAVLEVKQGLPVPVTLTP